jgi:hypothetical protein
MVCAETGGATGLSDGRPIRALGSLRQLKPETIVAGLGVGVRELQTGF